MEVRSEGNRNRGRLVRILASGVASLIVVGLVLWIGNEIRGDRPSLTLSGVAIDAVAGWVVVFSYTVSILGLTLIGVVMASRLPQNPIGWIVLWVGMWGAITFFTETLLWSLAGPGPGGALADLSRWIGRWAFVPVITIPITIVLMLAPDGRLLSPRWRLLPWLAAVGIAGWAGAEAFNELTPLVPNPYPNPRVAAVAEIALLALVPASAGSVISIVVRFRRANQNVRQQIKWVAFGGALQVSITFLLWILSVARPAAFGSSAVAVGTATGLITPLANGIAIFKYRLYDIDRLINRTVTYGAVVGVLAATYGFLAIGIPQLLHLPSESPLLVAIATLVSFIVFRPARRWIQSAIDRRFNRARYDAAREVENFSEQLTQRVAMDQVLAATTVLLERTLQPHELAVWIRDPGNL